MIDWNQYKTPKKDNRPLTSVPNNEQAQDDVVLPANTHFTPYKLTISVNQYEGPSLHLLDIPVSWDHLAWYSYVLAVQVQPDGGLHFSVENYLTEESKEFKCVGDGSSEPLHLGVWITNHVGEVLHAEGFAIPDTGFWYAYILPIRPRQDKGLDIGAIRVVVPSETSNS